MNPKKRDIFFIWFIMLILYLLSILGSFDLVTDKMENSGISMKEGFIKNISIVFFVINYIMLLIQALIFSIIIYVISIITQSPIDKQKSLYIMSFVLMIKMLTVIPIAIVNLFFTDSLIIPNQNLIYLLLDPFLLLSLYFLYNLLKRNNMKIKMIFTSLTIYYLLQVVFQSLVTVF